VPWLLGAVGLLTLALGINVLAPTRSLPGLAVGFLAEWLVAELAQWTALVLGGLVVALALLGGLDGPAGWVGLGAAGVGGVLLAVEIALAVRSGPAVRWAMTAAGFAPPTPEPGRWRRLLAPFRVTDRRVERIADLRYAPGADRRHLCDVYRPRGGCAGAPVLLQIHGGGWIIGDKRQQGRPLMNRMAAAGWVCVAINYRLAPKARFPDPLVDVKAALAWIRAHVADLGGDPARVVVTGGSAGGHLAALAALTAGDPAHQPGFEDADTSVLAAVPLYPPTDLVALLTVGGRWAQRWADRMSTWVFGTAPGRDPERLRGWSPLDLAERRTVPFLVVQGTADNLVPVAQTRVFVDRLRATPGPPVVYLELPGAPHAFDVFHSLRTEAAISAIHQFCVTVAAQAAPDPADPA
jgi:acetyl esterase/lipase